MRISTEFQTANIMIQIWRIHTVGLSVLTISELALSYAFKFILLPTQNDNDPDLTNSPNDHGSNKSRLRSPFHTYVQADISSELIASVLSACCSDLEWLADSAVNSFRGRTETRSRVYSW